MTAQAQRLFILQYGAERVPKSLSLRGGSADLYWEPLFGVHVETKQGLVLFDTGMSRSALDSATVQEAYMEAASRSTKEQTERQWRMYPRPLDEHRWNWGLNGDPLVSALAKLGLAPKDLSLAVISHMHLDHSGGVPTLAASGVPVAVQTVELDFARSGWPTMEHGYLARDWSAEQTDWVLLDGDAEVAPGVEVLSTPGHTPGHSSLRVDLPGTGTWIFTADSADVGQNLLDGVPCGSCVAATDGAEERADASFKRLLQLAERCDARLVPGHDQVVVNAIRHPHGGHR